MDISSHLESIIKNVEDSIEQAIENIATDFLVIESAKSAGLDEPIINEGEYSSVMLQKDIMSLSVSRQRLQLLKDFKRVLDDNYDHYSDKLDSLIRSAD